MTHPHVDGRALFVLARKQHVNQGCHVLNRNVIISIDIGIVGAIGIRLIEGITAQQDIDQGGNVFDRHLTVLVHVTIRDLIFISGKET